MADFHRERKRNHGRFVLRFDYCRKADDWNSTRKVQGNRKRTAGGSWAGRKRKPYVKLNKIIYMPLKAESWQGHIYCSKKTALRSKGSNGKGSVINVAAHLFWLQINLIDCHRINRYNDISIEKEKVPEHLFFCRDKCSGTIYKHGYYIKIRNRIQWGSRYFL